MPRIAPRTISVTGYKHFLTPLRRLIFDYDPLSPSQHGIRAYLRKPLLSMAEANPDVEVLVRKLRRGKAAVLRGHYGAAPGANPERFTVVLIPQSTGVIR